jgi:predicted kinase
VTNPRLIVVSGAPASGKTTLARRLAGELGLALLTKDLIKETLFDTLGVPSAERSVELSAASFAVLASVGRELLAAGVSVILEANYQRGRSERDLGPLVAGAKAVLVHCETTRDEIVRRYTARISGATDRHPGHGDAGGLPVVLERIDAGVYEPLDLAIPVIRVDTTDGYRPMYEEIRRFLTDAASSLSTFGASCRGWVR